MPYKILDCGKEADHPSRVTLQCDTDLYTLRMVRKQVAAAATALGASHEDAQKIELAVGEALANAYLHGYAGGSGPVEIELIYDGYRLQIAIHDEGQDFPSETPAPMQGPGYGLRIIKELMDEVELRDSRLVGRGTTIRMALRLQ